MASFASRTFSYRHRYQKSVTESGKNFLLGFRFVVIRIMHIFAPVAELRRRISSVGKASALDVFGLGKARAWEIVIRAEILPGIDPL